VPRPEAADRLLDAMREVKTDVGGELAEPIPMLDALNALDEKDRFEFTSTDNEEMERQFGQLVGQFLLDRAGMIRWVNIEGTRGVADIGSFPTDEEFLALAARLPA
jgi:hypothetical protein